MNLKSFCRKETLSIVPDAYAVQLVRAVDRQSKDLGSNLGIVKSVSFPTERFHIL